MANGPMKTLILDFLGYTTIHGLGRLAATKFWIQKLVWTLACLSSLAAVLYTTQNLYQQYLSLPISTIISFEQKSQRFPTVQICNLNVIPFSKVREDKKLAQIVETTSDLTGIDMNLFTDVPLPKYTYESPIRVSEDTDTALRILNTMFLLRAYDKLEEDYYNNDTSSDFIVKCFFTSIPCADSDITDILSSDFDTLCVQFEVNDTIKTPGPLSGLELIVNVQQQEYVPFFSRSAGVKISIDNVNFDVPTGFDVDIGLSTVMYERLPGKTSRCTDSITSIAECVQNCTHFFATCGCHCAWKFWDCNGKYTTTCHTLEEFECIDLLVANSESGDCSYCSVPCYERTYHRTVSMSKWPAKINKPILDAIILSKNISIVDSADDLMSLRIYYSSLIIETEKEVYSYTLVNLVSDIGGQLGLWIGISVLSLLEVLELICLLIRNICKRNKLRVAQNELALSNPGKDNRRQPDIMKVEDPHE